MTLSFLVKSIKDTLGCLTGLIVLFIEGEALLEGVFIVPFVMLSTLLCASSLVLDTDKDSESLSDGVGAPGISSSLVSETGLL